MALWRIRATVDDRPGYLSVLTARLALRSVNILTVQVHATEGGALDDFLVEAPDSMTAADLVETVRQGRGRDPWVARADARGLVDEPTRLLGLAATVAGDPDRLDQAIAAALGDCEVTWSPGRADGRAGQAPGVMVLDDPAGGTMVVRRSEPAFSPAEFARAHALVQVAATVRAPSSSSAAT